MYNAIQTELVRIHTTTDEEVYEDIEPIGEQQHFRRRLTQLSEEGDVDEDDIKHCYEEDSPPTKKAGT